MHSASLNAYSVVIASNVHWLRQQIASSSRRRSATTAASCSIGELARQRLRVGDLARQLGEIHLQHAQHLVDARQRHVGLGEDALDARLRHAERVGEVGVGDAGRAQLRLEGVDEVLGRAHGCGSASASGDAPLGYCDPSLAQSAAARWHATRIENSTALLTA